MLRISHPCRIYIRLSLHFPTSLQHFMTHLHMWCAYRCGSILNFQYVQFTSGNAKFNLHTKHAYMYIIYLHMHAWNVKPAHECIYICMYVCVVALICVDFRTDFTISIQKNVSLHFAFLLSTPSLRFLSFLDYFVFIDGQFSPMRQAPCAQRLANSRAQ